MREIGNLIPLSPVQPPTAVRKSGDGRRRQSGHQDRAVPAKVPEDENVNPSDDPDTPHIDEYA